MNKDNIVLSISIATLAGFFIGVCIANSVHSNPQLPGINQSKSSKFIAANHSLFTSEIYLEANTLYSIDPKQGASPESLNAQDVNTVAIAKEFVDIFNHGTGQSILPLLRERLNSIQIYTQASKNNDQSSMQTDITLLHTDSQNIASYLKGLLPSLDNVKLQTQFVTEDSAFKKLADATIAQDFTTAYAIQQSLVDTNSAIADTLSTAIIQTKPAFFH